MTSRRRWMSWIAGAAVALLLVGSGALWLLRSLDATSSPSLPRNLTGPGLFTRDGRHSPLGAASVAFSGQFKLTDGDDVYTVAVAGTRTDSYRSLPVSSTAGISAILSPDGRRLAVVNGIVDLATGAVTTLPHVDGDYVDPQAWSPDGRYLATVEYAPNDDVNATLEYIYAGQFAPPTTGAALSIMDTSTGQTTVLSPLDPMNLFDGWIAAFGPNDDIAYQVGTSVHIASATGVAIRTVTLPVGTRIAGKGAWTNDGAGLAVVTESPCGCGRPWDARWTLSTITVATGYQSKSSYTVDGVIAVRMLGWADGHPVVQTFEPSPSGLDEPSDRIIDFRPYDPAVNDGYDYMEEVENLDEVWGSRVLLLTSAGTPRTLLVGGDQAESVDIADHLVAQLGNANGATRNGYPPVITGIHLLAAVAIAVLALLLAGIIVIIRWAVRRWRERAPRLVPAV